MVTSGLPIRKASVSSSSETRHRTFLGLLIPLEVKILWTVFDSDCLAEHIFDGHILTLPDFGPRPVDTSRFGC